MRSFDASIAASPLVFPSEAPQVLAPDSSAQSEAFSADSVRRIAHDLNNALATVTGYAQLLESQPDWPSHLARQLQTLSHDAARAVALANELLMLAQPISDTPSDSLLPPLVNASARNSNGVSKLGAAVEAGLPRRGQAGGAEILVVDDEEPVITLISEILTMDGYNVTPAFNGAEALAWTQMRSFDLIISDVRMPAVGGPAFYEILQTERPDLLRRVLFVTGDTVSLSTRHFLAGTQRPVLAKPFDPDRLLDMVRQCLAS